MGKSIITFAHISSTKFDCMKRTSTLIALLLGFLLHANAQLLQPFLSSKTANGRPKDTNIKSFRSFIFDKNGFENSTGIIPHISAVSEVTRSNSIIELPMADGSNQRFYIVEMNVLAKESAAEHPEIRTYDLQSIDGKISGRATYSPLGFNVLFLTPTGRQYISPFSNSDAINHAAYYLKDYYWPDGNPVKCGVDGIGDEPAPSYKTTTQLGACAQTITYTIAIAATGEFTTWAGSQSNAIASITTTISNISLLYSKEVHISFSLVTNNSIVFTSAATDPYATVSFPTVTELNTNHTTLNTNVGTANYNLGLVFNDGWNGGLAYTPAVCDASVKGGGAAGISGNPAGPVMEGVVAHEMAHMFSAKHTMSSGTDVACAANVNLPTAYEPGGGSTIMAYAGSVCSGLAYQNNTDFYFHYNSVAAILSYAFGAVSCGTTSSASNNPPVLTVPATSYTIPHSTPFELTATATDPNASNVLTYSFEQYDLAPTYMTAPPSSTATSGPIFRSRPPTTSNTRILPPLADILANTTNPWEVLTSVTRTVNFKVLARDNAQPGCLAEENIAVNVNAGAGPFAITSQNSAANFTANGTNTMTVTWNVANTTAAPVSSSNVNILFSTDNGQTFPYTLASNTANDGTENVIVPNLNTTNGRIKVKGGNNIFFDINNAKVTVTSSCTANGSTFSPSTNVIAVEGNAALNLSLSPNYGTTMTISGNITSTDPTTDLAVVNGSGSSCISFSNQFQYDVYTFQVNVAGTYTFAQSGSTPTGTIYNLYENAYDPANPCTNFITSNGVYSGSVSLNGNLSATLSPGITYVMAVGTFSSTQPTVPFAYTINVTAPAGGNIYNGTPPPGAGFNYRYVIVNNTTGNIVAIVTTPNLTNVATYLAGNYTIYGLSVSSSVSQSTLNTYAGGAFSAFQTALLNGTICGNLSANSILVTIQSLLNLQGIKLFATPSGGNAKLTWHLSGDDDVVNFLVEKTATGSNFEPIGNVAGNHSGAYKFMDNKPFQGENYYRIKATQPSGNIVYSNAALISFKTVASGEALIFPNPVSGTATVRLPKEDNYDCVLSDVSGRTVKQLSLSDIQFTLDLSSLAPGIYILRCNSTTDHIISRIVKQ